MVSPPIPRHLTPSYHSPLNPATGSSRMDNPAMKLHRIAARAPGLCGPVPSPLDMRNPRTRKVRRAAGSRCLRNPTVPRLSTEAAGPAREEPRGPRMIRIPNPRARIAHFREAVLLAVLRHTDRGRGFQHWTGPSFVHGPTCEPQTGKSLDPRGETPEGKLGGLIPTRTRALPQETIPIVALGLSLSFRVFRSEFPGEPRLLGLPLQGSRNGILRGLSHPQTRGLVSRRG